MPIPAGCPGRTGAGPDRVGAAECEWGIDGQRPVTGGAGPAPFLVEPKSASPSRMALSLLVVLISLLVARGTWHRSSHLRPCRRPRFWSMIAARVVAWVTCKRSGEGTDPAGRTPTHPHSGQFMTRVHTKPISRFHRHPLRLGPAPLSPRRASAHWSTAAYRHDRLNPADHHISQ